MTADVLDNQHPLRREGLARRGWPFIASIAVGIVVASFAPNVDAVLVTAAAATTIVVVLAAFLLPWGRLPAWLTTVPPLTLMVVVAMLRHASGGIGEPVDFEILLVVPVVWLALYGTTLGVLFALAFGAVGFAVSIVHFELGAYAWTKTVLWPVAAGLVAMHIRMLVRRLSRHAEVDSLTGLGNRRVFERELRREVARAERTGAAVSLALADVDHFKRFNDTFGHQAGDVLLRESARAWMAILRGMDVGARFGGEEFAFVIVDADLDDVVAIAERLRRAIRPPATCSIGVATYRRGDDADSLVRRADRALYRAKNEGRDRVSLDQDRSAWADH